MVAAGIDGGSSHLIQGLFDGADTVGYVELFLTLPDGELWVGVYHIQNAAKGAAGIIHFESRDYPLVE